MTPGQQTLAVVGFLVLLAVGCGGFTLAICAMLARASGETRPVGEERR